MSKIESDDLADRYYTAAKRAGCTRAQMERYTRYGYVALPHFLPFHAAAHAITPGCREIMLDGTRGSAKSHAIIAQVGLDDCQAYPGIKYLFLRLTAKSAGESFEDLTAKVLRGIRHEANSERVHFLNGSRILIGGYKDDGDISKYIGIEYDGIVIEEATLIPGHRYEQLLGSLRTSREDWIPRVYLSTNPGGIGHAYYKDRFILPHRTNRETTTRRYYSSYRDNPFIDIGYRTYLDNLTGDLARKWRDADWDIFEGQAFAWVAEKDGKPWHVIRRMPDGWERWPKWRAVDWGYNAPFACLWMTRDPSSGRVYVYREAYAANVIDRHQARMIRELTPPAENIQLTYADPSMWISKTQGEYVTTTAQEYALEGVPLTRADNDRKNGKRKIDRLLEPLPDGLPGIQVLETCHNLIRTLPALVYDTRDVEDVDSDGEDHAYDALKYGLTNTRDYRETTMTIRQRESPLAGVAHL